jgi:uncharacterized protein (TIGR04255 family)
MQSDRVRCKRGTLLERWLGMFNLTAAPRYRLTRPPLVRALADIRFSVRPELASLEGIARIQDRVQGYFPYLRQQNVQQISLTVGPNAPTVPSSQTSQIWQFDDGGGWTLAISPGSATLFCGPSYGQFAEFAERFGTVLGALKEAAGALRAERLGVRYINIAELPPGDENAWRQWFRPELIGWSGTEIVGERARLITAITQTQLACEPSGELAGLPAEVQAVVRHGLIPANTAIPGLGPAALPQGMAYLLDIDVYEEAPQEFDPSELSGQATAFHDQIDRFFYWALADEGAKYFGLEVAE